MMIIPEDTRLESLVVKMWYLGSSRCADGSRDFGVREKSQTKKMEVLGDG